ncbi:MAG TPA: DNA polymerase [Candidatus Deferrimicrobiaceae bacterium]|nr:DNA polymerase [Candidatus Deferrimicrobiaceae bacterium]
MLAIEAAPAPMVLRVGGWPAEDVTIRYACIEAELYDVRLWLVERSTMVLGIDIETNAKDPWELGFACRTVQFADVHESWVIEVNAETETWIAELIRLHPQWVAHYAEKDISFAHRGLRCSDGSSPIRLGERVPHVVDSQTALAMFDPRTVTTQNKKDRIPLGVPRPKGLKPNTTRLLTPALEYAERELHAWFHEIAPIGHRAGVRKPVSWGFANAPTRDPRFIRYAGLDPIMGLRLFLLAQHHLTRRGQWDRCGAALSEQWMMDNATTPGMQVDGPYAKWLWGELQRVIDERKPLLEHYGIGESGMGPSVGRAFESRGVPCPSKDRRTGKPTWNKDALIALSEHENPYVAQLATAIREVRKARKFRTTYIEPMLWAVDNGDGAMHCSVRAIGTVTTRMSAQKTDSAGPLQQLPKKDPRVRAAVCAKRGHVLVTADFRQGEPFVMAALSGDLGYLADLERGDINSTIAAMAYGDAYVAAEGKTSGALSYLMRQNGKAGWLACCYGAGAPTLAWTLSVNMPPEFRFTAERASEVLRTWHATYPRFWSYADELNREGVLTLDSGHRVPLWDRVGVREDGTLYDRGRPSRLGLNAKTQGTQADLLKVAMHRLLHWGWLWAFRFALHDELVLEVPEPMAEFARAVLERAMTIVYRGVTIRCEAVIEGKTWLPQPREFNAVDLPDFDDEENVS